MIRYYLQKIFSLQVWWIFSCQDVYNLGELTSDWYHLVTWAHNETTTLYCSIDNEKRAWTRVERNFLWSQGWSFAWGNHISTHSFSLFSTPSANEIISLQSPKNSGYVMRQQWNNISNYEIKMKDFSYVLSWDEIRLSLWARWDYTWEWSSNLWFNPHAGYLFYNRLYYSDGSFSTNWEMKLIDTQMIWWEHWNKYEVRHRVRKTPQDFFWYIGLDAADSVDFYFTWVNIEVFRR